MPADPELPESRQRPLPADLDVRAARDAYLAENGFTVAAYDAKWTDARVLGITFKVPNTDRHRLAIRLHDLHHAATGYGTDLLGEVEVSAWECRRGLGPLGLYVATIVVGLTLFGLLIAPVRTWRAWCAGARAPRGTGSLFHTDDAYETLLTLSLGDLRARLNIPRGGLHRGPRRLVAGAPGRVAAEVARAEAPSTAQSLAIQVALLLGGLAAYLLLSETGSRRDDGYAFVVAIHLALLAAASTLVGLRLAVQRGSGA